MRRTALLLVLLAGLAQAQSPPAPAAGPPASPVEPVTETLHGTTFTDPYRWLEGDEAGKVTDKVAAWTDAQNGYTRRVLDGLPGRAEVEKRIGQLMSVGSIGAPTMREGLYFNREREGTQNQSVLYVRDGLDAERRVLLDPNALDAQGLISLDWTEPSQDGALVAFGLSRRGSENATLHILETKSGSWLSDEIPGKTGDVAWFADGRSFLYESLEKVEDPYSKRIKLHVVGRHWRQDPVLVAQTSTTWGPFAYPSKDGRWLLVGEYTSTRANDLWVVDLDRWRRTGELVKTPILVGKDATAAGPILGDTLFMQTTFEAPRGRVVAVDLARPDPKGWRVVLPEPKEPTATLAEVQLARGLLVARVLDRACTRLERFTTTGEPLGPLQLPGLGSAWISTSDDRTEAFVTYTSFNEPPSIYRLDLVTGASTLWKRPDVPVDPSTITVRQVEVASKDGTKVGLFLVHRKDLKLGDGQAPTLLYGYGGFGISMTPSFSASLFPFLERGGVYAVANLRGGGELGDAWHEAGTLAHKQNVFDDAIACAEWLVSQEITSKDKLAVAGGSNGGLLVGALVTQRPDLFRAAVCGVPLLDMLRYHRFLMARFWVPEYGSAEDPKQFEWLKAYSPYQRVTKSTKYPAVLVTAGENDSRVHPLHARKFAAALQAATACDPQERPILLWVDRDAGHGSGKPLALRIRDVADERMFLFWQLGMLPPK